MPEYIDAKLLKNIFLSGTKSLLSQKELINELNVFPVPDGDTGTNMSLTLLGAVKELDRLSENPTMHDVCKAIAQGTLKSARGNSGVIMSQLCGGFMKELATVEKADAKKIASAFVRAKKTAYKAVMNPQEGTILTVAKDVSNYIHVLAKKKMPYDVMFKEILEKANESLERTPELLPVLKEAGVVDSGGKGLLEFYKGAYNAFCGEVVVASELLESAASNSASQSPLVDTSKISTADIKFGYCTEFIINLQSKYTAKDDASFKAFLESKGDSIVCVSMDTIVKVHVHTNHPGEVIEKALTLGSLSKLKIDNMREEHNEKVIKEADRFKAEEAAKKEAKKGKAVKESDNIIVNENCTKRDVGFIAVCAGEGIVDIYKDMLVDVIIEGGQTMNPSTEDFLAALDRVNSDVVFIFPNNKNVILAAEQAQKIYKGKHVRVIPTCAVTEGLSALIAFVPAKSIDENVASMCDIIKEVKTIEITYAVRKAKLDGILIKKGDYMAICGKTILGVAKNPNEAGKIALSKVVTSESELVTIYSGEDVKDSEANEFFGDAESLCKLQDVSLIFGKQPIYSYIISVE